MRNYNVLVVEDDADILELVSEALTGEGFEVKTAEDGQEALVALEDFQADLIVLDLMLPKRSGLEVLRILREEYELAIPVVILTALDEEEDRLRGFELGATDYVVKPFSVKELVARCKVHTQGILPESGETLEFGDVRVELDSHRVFVEDEEVHLRPKEFELLKTLAEHPEQVLSRTQLLNMVWGLGSESNAKTVDVTIRTLREKVELDPSDPQHIETVRGYGYRFSTEATNEEQSA